MKLLELFLAFLQIGALAIGGGYATIPLIQNMVFSKQWLTAQEFSDIVTISQMTPGPLAVNTSTFVGIRIAGIAGAVVATLGCVIVGVMLSILLCKFFASFSTSRYVQEALLALRASSTGLILSAAMTIVISALWGTTHELSISSCVIMVVSLFILQKYKVNSIYLIIATGILGIILYT